MLLVAPGQTDCATVRVGSRGYELVFSLLVVGLSLAPGLKALVPAVLRDAHGWHQLERAQLKILDL